MDKPTHLTKTPCWHYLIKSRYLQHIIPTIDIYWDIIILMFFLFGKKIQIVCKEVNQ